MECLSPLRSIKKHNMYTKKWTNQLQQNIQYPFETATKKTHIVSLSIEQAKIIRTWFSHHRGPFHVKLDHRGQVLWHLQRILWWSFALRKGQGNWTCRSGPWPLCQFYQGALREKVGEMRIWIFVFKFLNKRSPGQKKNMENSLFDKGNL